MFLLKEKVSFLSRTLLNFITSPISTEKKFLGKVGRETVFYDILERKNAFQGYKKRSSKSPNIDIFPKWLVHGFGPKLAIFPSVHGFRNLGQENVF